MWSALFYSCSADWYIRQAQRIDPTAVVNTTDTIRIPEVSIDTFVQIEKDTAGLSAYIDSLLTTLPIPDTCLPFIKVIKEPVIEYVEGMPVLLDTAFYETTFEADGVLISMQLYAFQEGDQIRIGTKLLDSKVLAETTTIVASQNKKERRQERLYVFLVGIFAGLLIVYVLHEALNKD